LTGTLDIRAMPRLLFSIAPQRYDAKRLTIEECFYLVSNARVTARGWSFPYVREEIVSVGPLCTYIRGGINLTGVAVEHVEEWRMYCSGQFVYRRMPWEVTDIGWRDKTRESFEEFQGRQLSADILGFLSYELLLFTVTEAYIFASRLAQSARYDTPLDVRIGLRGAKGYALASADPTGPLFDVYWIKTTTPLEDHAVVELDKLISDPKASAVVASTNLLQQFGWMRPPSREALAQLQLGYYP
jgi:hypothetical protein